MGNGIKVTNMYDTDGYLSKIIYDKSTTPVSNVLTLTTDFDKNNDNLKSRINSAFGNYTETFEYDALDRLTKFTNKLGVLESQTYDASGKITGNSLGTYDYDAVKKYQNTAINMNTAAVSYYSSRGNLNVSYNAFKSPIEIEELNVDKIGFSYNSDNQRSTIYYGGFQTNKFERPLRKYYSADGTMEVKENRTTNKLEFITFIGGDGYSASIAAKNDGSTLKYLYLHRDYQGTIVAVTDENAVVLEKRLFDAWGSTIKVQDGSGNLLNGFTVLDRGYTGHEHLQSVGLINMNARLYDPMLHRFLQVDNFIQDASSTQNYNQYGYVLNNPLKYTDLSGNKIDSPQGGCDTCGPSETEQSLIGGIISTVVTNWDSWGIKDWANKNINLKKWDRWRKDTFNLRNRFGGKKSSSPPPVAPNMSSYLSLNNENFKGLAIDSNNRGTVNSNRNSVNSTCPECLNPATIGHNLFYLSYPGGDNPQSYNDDYSYSYVPKNISEYQAIGHDRRYDNLKIQGLSGLLTDARATGADWKFVMEESKLALIPGYGIRERFYAGSLGIGLGLFSLPKTLLFIAQPGGFLRARMWYEKSNKGVNNAPTVHKH